MPEEPTISARRATDRDIDDLSRLREAFWRDQMGRGLRDPPADCSVAATSKLIERARTHVIVADDVEGSLCAYLLGQTKLVPGTTPAKVSSIEEVYVCEAARRAGIAVQLVDAALAAFRADGADRIQLRVLEENNLGLSFWISVGFKPYLTVFELASSYAR